MKKKLFIGLIVAIIFAAAVVYAGDLPATGKYDVYGIGNEMSVSVASGNAVAKIPTPASQNLPDAKWQIYCSRAWTDGTSWNLEGKNDYAIQTRRINSDYVEATIPLLDNGNGWNWLRCWGKDERSGQWLWIERSSKYNRPDKHTNPGYEFVANSRTGENGTVPSEYRTRP
jgi:hypothetical protein